MWKKGQSGNPSGRPRKTDADREVEQLIGDFLPEATRKLIAMIRADQLDQRHLVAVWKMWADKRPIGTDEPLPDNPSEWTPAQWRTAHQRCVQALEAIGEAVH